MRLTLCALIALGGVACSKGGDGAKRGKGKAATTGARFAVEAKGKKHVFRLYADDTRVLLESDPYADRGGAKAGIKALDRALDEAKCFRHRIVVKAKNGQPLARSPKYPDKQRCEEGLALAQTLIRKAKRP